MTINQMEIRLNDFQSNTNVENKLTVAGYVNKTNQWSQPLGTRNKFVEKIEPGAFKKALQNGNEIHFLAEHDNAKILSSTRNGSLSLREDENGLFMEAEISPTSWGRDYHQLIKDGIIRNMSFGMKVVKDKWDKLADGTYQRSISDIVLAEVSAVRNPAYVQSTIAARSIEVVEDVEVPDEEKRELTIQEQLEAKKSHLKMTQNLIEWGDTSLTNEAEKLKGEIKHMEAEINTQTAPVKVEKQEKRMINTSVSAGYQQIPKKLSEEVINIAKKQAGVAARIRLETGVGRSSMLVDLNNSPMTITNEDTAIDPTLAGLDPNFKEVNFIQARLTTANVVSNQLANDTGIDVKAYMTNIHAHRALTGIEQNMFELGTADGVTGFQNILLHNQALANNKIENIAEVIGADTTTVTHDELFDAFIKFAEYPDNLLGAVIVVEDLKKFAAIKDADGKSILELKGKQDGTAGTAFGMPVLKTPKFVAGTKSFAVFMNPGRAYGAKLGNGANGVSKDPAVADQTRVIAGDTTQALRGSEVLLSELYGAGKVINPRAIVIVKTA
ncbi:HK97 family phage prohead protease [Peribacillus simplex]|uniref:HK97 family phage prohead protease n=1 Tax=Peribacillus simplex TaxID=1478 RepID=UPI002E2044CE|nr:HK97 family phage prohead protease [Peribacillus simplex]MED3986296.1 HK97 family phage prohead protease [Peribacillus simplex]MED4096832.1 HK97 family phage prohead protease [Peribacillus simplex]